MYTNLSLSMELIILIFIKTFQYNKINLFPNSIHIGLELPPWLSGKESTWHVGDFGLIPGWGRSPGGGSDNPLQYSCLDNLMNRGAWWAVRRATELGTTEKLKRLSTHAHRLMVSQIEDLFQTHILQGQKILITPGQIQI